MNFNIVTVPGDGIGPDVIGEAVNVLNAVGKNTGTFSILRKRRRAASP